MGSCGKDEERWSPDIRKGGNERLPVNMQFGALAWRKRLRKVAADADPHINIFSGDDRVLGRPIYRRSYMPQRTMIRVLSIRSERSAKYAKRCMQRRKPNMNERKETCKRLVMSRPQTTIR